MQYRAITVLSGRPFSRISVYVLTKLLDGSFYNNLRLVLALLLLCQANYLNF